MHAAALVLLAALPTVPQDEGLESRLYRAALAAAEAQLALHATDRAREWLDEAPEALRGWEWRHLERRADRSSARAELEGGTITDLDVSPDGTLLAAGARDGTVRLLDARALEVRRVLTGHTAAAWSPRFSHAGDRLATASSDGTLRLWDVATGKALHVLEGNGRGVAAAAWSPDDARVVVTSWTMKDGGVVGTVRVWNAQSGSLERSLEHGIKPIAAVDWSDDGALVAAGTWDSDVALYDARTWEAPRRLVPEESEDYTAVRDLDFAAGSHRLAVSYADGRARVWDADAGTIEVRLDTSREGLTKELNDVVVLGDGRFATAGEDLTVRLWDAGGRALATWHGPLRSVLTIAASPDGAHLYTAGADAIVRAWDLATLAPERSTWRLPTVPYSIVLDPAGQRAASAAWEGVVRIHDPRTGAELRSWVGHEGSGVAAAWSPDGRRLATTGNDGRICLWDPESGALVRELCHVGRQLQSVAFSADGARIAAPTCSGPEADASWFTRVWDAAGEPLRDLHAGDSKPRMASWAPAGRTLAVAHDGGLVLVWDADEGRPLTSLQAGDAGTVHPVFSRDGAHLWTAAGPVVRVWSTASWTLERELAPRESGVRCMQLSPDGTRLAYGTDASSLEVADATTGAVLLRVPTASTVWALTWTPDGGALLAAVLNGVIRVLD